MTEDELSEAVALKLLEGRGLENPQKLGISGFGYLKKSVEKFCKAANNGLNVFMLTDLDQTVCAPLLIADWFKSATKSDKFLFRVAVREVEAWVMADRQAFADFFGDFKR